MKIIEVNDINKLPENYVQYAGTSPEPMVEAFQKKYKKKPERIYHYSNSQGNWQFFGIPLEAE